MGGWFYGPYVSVKEKTAIAAQRVQQLRKKGQDVKPIEAFKGALATTFWGKRWNEHLEKYADFDNRLGRGRSYVRNGLICDLQIGRGAVVAKVSGTELYTVTIVIRTLDPALWQQVCAKCAGQIGSLVELLHGKFSQEVMQIVCDPVHGIFPQTKDIKLKCSCPDWAVMCKHVSAVLYAIGRRLDTDPGVLFTLRGVDPSDLLPTTIDLGSAATDDLDLEQAGEIFDIDLDLGSAEETKQALAQSAQSEATKSQANPKLQAPSQAQAKDKAQSSAFTFAPSKIATKKQEAKAPSKVTGKKSQTASQSTTKSKTQVSTSQTKAPNPAKTKASPQKSPVSQAKSQSPTSAKAAVYNGVAIPNKAVERAPKILFDPSHPTGRGIQVLRNFSGLSQANFAKAIGVAATSVSRWENTSGEIFLQKTSLIALEKLAAFLINLRVTGK